MRKTFSLLGLLALTPLALAQDRPLPPRDAAKAMTLPPGFKATLFAGEPDVVQPIAFTFDDRGRLWVVECLSYPKWTADKSGHDRVTIYEDADGDGTFDKKTVFFDHGANLSGIEVGFGGVWLCSTPDLLFIPDKDGDDKPDGPPQVVLDGWDLKAKHNVFNALTWGPDGWLYGCNGILSNSLVGKPGAAMADRVALNCGVWRYHPTRQVFEAVAHGTTNPWGLDFDEAGEMFITNCVIEHVWHAVPGAHFLRMFGEDVTPHVYGLMPSIADHLHWGGGHWTSSRGGKGVHDAPGGGHAHSGCMVYLGDNWPEEYRNNLFTCNIHGNRVNRDTLREKGSTYVASHAPDVLLANDPWFRGLTLKYGPDGGVYVCDWSDTGECHNYEKVDASNGRIFKVTHGTPKPWRGDIGKLSDRELVALQTHRNDWFSRHARRVLQERAAAGRLDPQAITDARAMFDDAENPYHRLRALWLLHATGQPNVLRVQDSSEMVRRWSIRLLTEDPAKVDFKALFQAMERPIDLSPSVKLALLSTIQRIPAAARVEPLDRLLPLVSERRDPYLALMSWYAVEPVLQPYADEAVKWLAFTQQPIVREFMARRLTEIGSDYLELMFKSMSKWPFPEVWAAESLKGVQDGLAGRKEVKAPPAWAELEPKLRASPSDLIRWRALQLSLIFGDAAAMGRVREVARSRVARPEVRREALMLLRQKQAPGLLDVLKPLLEDKAMRADAIRGLAAVNDGSVPDLLLHLYPSLTDLEKADVIQTLVTRSVWAKALLEAVAENKVPARDVSPLAARQVLALKDAALAKQLEQVWGTVRPAGKEKAELLTRFRELLKPETVAKADVAKGKQLFAKTCASCHKLAGEGRVIGPDLTGSQRTNLDYLLENVLDPNAVVPREYSVTVVELKDGRTLSGIVAQETPQAVTLQTANERLVLPRGDVESITPTKASLMPEGLFDKLTPEELRDLVGFLMRK